MTSLHRAGRQLALARITVGLIQGLALYSLLQAMQNGAWPATHAIIFHPAYLTALLLPIMLLLALGRMGVRALAAWAALAAAAIVGLTIHDVARNGPPDAPAVMQLVGLAPHSYGTISFTFVLILCAGLFIGQSLVVAAAGEQRPIPSYARLFDTSWDQAIEVVLAAVFVGLFWGVLWLGAGLFNLVGLHGFARLISHRWFAVPVTTAAIALAIETIDVGARLTRGTRTLVLLLLACLLPVLAAIASAFLGSLFFVSLAPLCNTHLAAHLLSAAAVILVLLVNAVYQDGSAESTPSGFMRIAGRLGAVVLAPIVALAAAALAARVGQHGWSVERVLSATFPLVAAAYALGYGSAALRRRRWLAWIARVNVFCAFLSLAVIVLLLTPVADPVPAGGRRPDRAAAYRPGERRGVRLWVPALRCGQLRRGSRPRSRGQPTGIGSRCRAGAGARGVRYHESLASSEGRHASIAERDVR